jgi:hypothetical protein
MAEKANPGGMVATSGLRGAEPHEPRLALLLGAPHCGEVAMHNDICAIVPVLRARGFGDKDLLRLVGQELERRAVLEFLGHASSGISSWRGGEVFLYVSGHGEFTGDTAEPARLAVRLSGDSRPLDEVAVFWDEIFAALALPPGATLTLLPDT